MTSDSRSADSAPLHRRSLLFGASALGAGGILGGTSSAAGSATPPPTDVDPDLRGLLAGSCIVTASDVEGPYFLDLDLVRNDITEGYPGVPLRVYLRIHGASSCAPIENAVVDVWHCEAQGVYSGFAVKGTQGLTYLRGVQLTPQNGLVWFDTIYPGFYAGRTSHVHVKVRPNAGAELTTQLYFPQSVNERVSGLAPYLGGGPITTNAQDGFFDPERVFTLRRDPNGPGILAGKTLVVNGL